jgi:elongation factor G
MSVRSRAATWVLSVRIEPNSQADQLKLPAALEILVVDDPSLGVLRDPESGETVLRGMSELHLDKTIETLKTRHDIKLKVFAPEMAYLETLASVAEIDREYLGQKPGITGAARVRLRVEPLESDSGNYFVSELTGRNSVTPHLSSIEHAVRNVWEAGVRLGYPLVDTKVTLLEVTAEDSKSTKDVLVIATRFAMRQACLSAGVEILEPVMDVTISTSTNQVHRVLADIADRRGVVRAKTSAAERTAIRADIPLAHMFGYVSSLNAITDGSGIHTTTYSHYQTLPRNITENDPENFPPAIGMRA